MNGRHFDNLMMIIY